MDRAAEWRVFISAGDLSGDLHASRLLRALGEHPAVGSLHVSALGSLNLRDAGAEVLFDTARLSAMGVLSNLVHAFTHLRLFRETVKRLLREPPDAVILVDWRFFNLNFARSLRAGGYDGAIIYFVAPVLWQAAADERYVQIAEQPEAFRRKVGRRFELMREHVDLALLAYPIGLELYEHFKVNHAFIGHPLCDGIEPSMAMDELRELVGAAKGAPLVGLMPGSRQDELAVIGNELIRAVPIINKQIPEAVFALPVAHPDLRKPLQRLLRRYGVNLTLLAPEQRYDLVAHADLMIVASGTATHECAVAGTPHIAVYRLHPLQDFLYSTFTRFRLPAYAFPNIIAGHRVVPELVRGQCNANQIARTAVALLGQPSELRRMRQELADVRKRICRPDTLGRAAQLVVDTVHSRLR